METKHLISIIVGITVILAIGCTIPEKAVNTEENTAKAEPVYRELIDMLSKEPGLEIKKAGSTYDITIRGKKSMTASHQPLFVIDGQIIGNNYADAANAILITDVNYITVLKGAEATSYGSRGANGVIEIYRKRGVKKS